MRYQLTSPYLKGNESKYLRRALSENWISSRGENIIKFERRFAEYLKIPYAIAVTNGTAALHLALLSLGIKEGDEVVVPDLTFAATINAVIYTGATPVIVDIEKDSWCMSPENFKKAITPKTRAVIPVHIYGQPCNMKAISKIALDSGIDMVEDCAEALGAEYNGKKVGLFGKVSCFSFYANKIITTGEGGMCVTKDKRIAERIKLFRDHGMNPHKKYWHIAVGYNYRLTNLQASIGLAQLERIDGLIKHRNRIEDFYRKNLSDISSLVPQRNDLAKRRKVTWLVSFLIKGDKTERDKLIGELFKRGIETRPFFYPLSRMPIYRNFRRNKISIAWEIAQRGINFPTDLNFMDSDLREIIKSIREIYKSK